MSRCCIAQSKEWTSCSTQIQQAVLPFAIDIKNREKFDANTILVRNNSGFINGGTSKERHSGVRWKMGDDIKCTFDHKNGTFSMFYSSGCDQENIPKRKIFYPFAAFSDPTSFADSLAACIFGMYNTLI